MAVLLGGAAAALIFLRQERALRRLTEGQKVDSKRLADVVGSVGRSAPLIRAIAKDASSAAALGVKTEAGVRAVAAALAPTPVRAPQAVAPSAKAPKGHAPALVEVAAATQTAVADERYRDATFVTVLNAQQYADARLRLSKKPISIVLEVEQAKSRAIELMLHSEDGMANARAAIIAAKVLDGNGAVIDHPVFPQTSERYGRFAYLGTAGADTKVTARLSLPATARTVKIELIEWSTPCEVTNAVRFTSRRENLAWRKRRSAKQVRVAAILDEFSFNSFKFECELVNLSPSEWKTQMDGAAPDLFFCESA